MKTIIVLIAFVLSVVTAEVDLRQLKCLVCRTTVDEFYDEVNKIDPTKKIEIGQYRLDSKGNTVHKQIPLSMSEVHLSEMLDTICKKMEDYVRATYKSNGKLTLLKLMSESGVSPLLSQVDIIQDGDLNKSLEFFCSEIVNEFEDTFVEIISKKEANAKATICTEVAGYCKDFVNDIDEEVEAVDKDYEISDEIPKEDEDFKDEL